MSDDSRTATTIPTLDTKTLRGDIRDAVLAEFKHLPKPWQAMNEDEQQRLITRAEDIAGELVRGAVDLVAARGLPSLPITVGKFTCEATELKGSFNAYPTDESLLKVRSLCDRRAVFVLADPDEFNGERKEAVPDTVGTLAMPKTTDRPFGAPPDQPAADAAPADGDEPRVAMTDDLDLGPFRRTA